MLLIYKKEDGAEKTARIKEVSLGEPVTIGRGNEAKIKLDDTRASRVHASILYWDDAYIIRDLDSANGIYVNGQKVKLSFIKPGDTLRIGDTEFRLLSGGSRDDVTMEGFTVTA